MAYKMLPKINTQNAMNHQRCQNGSKMVKVSAAGTALSTLSALMAMTSNV
jgi:hypothetical protein